MTDALNGRRLARALTCALILSGAAVPAAASAAVSKQPGAAVGAGSGVTARASACVTIDGNAENALRTGTNPVRFKYTGSPYLGLRYSSCGGTIRFYYGGYSGITHYNIKLIIINQGQIEVGPGLRRVLTRPETSWGPRAYAVQACNRGGLFESSTCTRWSPTVRLFIPREAAAS